MSALVRGSRRPSVGRERGAFTLIELLAAIAVLLVLIALLLPILAGARGRAEAVHCGSNMRQAHVLIIQFGGDHDGDLPRANSANISTFKVDFSPAATNLAVALAPTAPTANQLDRYLRDSHMSPAIWYCPSLARQLPKQRSPTVWMRRINDPDKLNDEIWIGMGYIGNPTLPARYKFRKDYPTRLGDLTMRDHLFLDYCIGLRMPTNVPGRGWFLFPHLGADDPQFSNLGMGDGSLQKRAASELTLGYAFDKPQDVYW